MAKRHRHDPPLSPTPADDNPTTTIDTDSDSSTNATTPKHYRPSQHPPQPAIIHCNFLPTCSHRPFTSYAAFESHYHQHHTHRCHECHRNFPSERYLTIHIAENHDAFNELKRERGERTFGCFVEGCEKVCLTPQKRRLHVIDKHGFPKDFYFRVVDYGIDHCNSLIRTSNRHSKTPKNQGHKNGSTTTTTTTTTDTSAPSSPESARKDTTNSEPGTKDLEMKDVGIDVDGPAVSASAAPTKANNDTLPHKRIPPVPKKGRSSKSGEGGIGVKSKEEAEVVADKQEQEQKQPEDAAVVAVDIEDKEMADVTNLMASVKLVPRQIRFGRRGGGMVGFVGNTRRSLVYFCISLE